MDTILLLTFFLILSIVLWALLGKGSGRKKGDEAIEALYRRRASDKEIEDQFPEDAGQKHRRKEDIDAEEKPGEPAEDFNLPYLADDIITERSRFKVFKRTLLNSEIYARKGDYNTAISLYQGVNKRINDKNVNSKIDANINYIKEYQKKITEKKKEAPERRESGLQQSEIKFTIDGPIKIPEKIHVDLSTLLKGPPDPKIDLEKMADEVASRLADRKLVPAEGATAADISTGEAGRPPDAWPAGGKPGLADIEDIDEIEEIAKEAAKKAVRGKTIAEALEGKTAVEQIAKRAVEEALRVRDITATPEIKLAVENMARKAVEEAIKNKAISESIEGRTVKDAIRDDIQSLESQYREEISKIKGEIEGLTSGKTPDAVTQSTIDKYESEIENLQGSISQLMDFKKKAEESKADTDRAIDEASLGKIKDVIKTLNDKIEQLNEREMKTAEELRDVKTYNRVFAEGLIQGKAGAGEGEFPEEADRMPALAEAKFQAAPGAAPAAADEKGISKELSEKIPAKEAPKPKPVTLPGKKGPADEKPDFELLSEYGKDEDEDIPDESDELSDADIFEKILKSDEEKKEEDAFEILGYKKEEKETGFDIEDIEVEKKRIEEEKFYRKFLKHEKRKKRELPILKVSYDFTKLPDDFSLSRDKNILEYSFYKYKALLEKANELIKTRNVKDAINYYRVVLSQNIPFEFKSMLRKNINELTEYIEKYLSTD